MQRESDMFEEFSYSTRKVTEGTQSGGRGEGEGNKKARRKKILEMGVIPVATLRTIKSWREKHEAPVDTMGC